VATPPDPDNPTIRVRLDWTEADGFKGGNRIYLNYSDGPPTATQCQALATYILTTLFPATLASLISNNWALTEVDVLDITTESGLSGTHTGSAAGTRGTSSLPAQCATNIEFNIVERYRGGKPRIYLPPGLTTDLANPSTYNSTYQNAMGVAWGDFIDDMEITGLVSANDLTHVDLSYYKGYATTTPPWRGPGFKYPPKYRPTAVSRVVQSYAVKTLLSSQKRRRAATTY